MFLIFLVFWLPLFVLCSIYFSEGITLYEGDFCTNNNKNGESRGRCKSAYDCSWALEQIKQCRKIDICHFKGRTPVVCCPLNQVMEKEASFSDQWTDQTTMPHLPIIEQNTPDLPTHLNVNDGSSGFGQLSKAKCDEYYPPPTGGGSAAAGGEKSLAKEFPHMAILGYGPVNDKQWKCGGSLISLQHVLTAAHCLHSRDLGDVKYVRVGDLDIKDETDDASPQDFNVISAVQHPDYESRTIKNDIAILKLDRPVTLTDYVKPACLHVGDPTESFQEITATGWGITEFAGEPNNHLLKVKLKIVEHDACRKEYVNTGDKGDIDDASQVCAGSADNEKIMDTCQGDSGGPLQRTEFLRGIHYTIVGITSFGKACGITKSAGVYTRVSFYLPWIESIAF